MLTGASIGEPFDRASNLFGLLANLLFPVLLGVSFRRVIGVLIRVEGMRPCYMGVMCRFLVVSRRLMFGCLGVMPSSMGMVRCCVFVVFGRFLGHWILRALLGFAN